MEGNSLAGWPRRTTRQDWLAASLSTRLSTATLDGAPVEESKDGLPCPVVRELERRVVHPEILDERFFFLL